MYQSRCMAKNSWWWAERLPETCRVVIPIKLEFSASVGFIHKESVTMHGHAILKWLNAFTVGRVNEWCHISSIKLTETWYVYCKAGSFFIFLDMPKFFSFGWYFRTFCGTLSQVDLSQWISQILQCNVFVVIRYTIYEVSIKVCKKGGKI